MRTEVSKKDTEIFKYQNLIRTKPEIAVKHLQEKRALFQTKGKKNPEKYSRRLISTID